MSGWGMAWMGVSSLLVFAVIVAGVVMLARYLSRSAAGPSAHPDGGAEQLLAQRYARGDIDDTEYRQRLAVLRGGQTPPPSGPAP